MRRRPAYFAMSPYSAPAKPLMRDYFYQLVDSLTALLQREEVLTCFFAAEETDFVRFNHARVRQAGKVTQHSIALDLIRGQRHASASLTLAGTLEQDQPRLQALLAELRELREILPPDPHLLYASEVNSSEIQAANELLASAAMIEAITGIGRGLDLVGILASGAQHNGFANSLGQRNWNSRYSFNFDWSLYLQDDKAVKARYAGFQWQDDELRQRMQNACAELEILGRAPRSLRPGDYRVYLTPMALEEIIDLLGWGGFGLRAHRTGSSPLLRMTDQDVRLNPALTLIENTADGIAPDFQQAGFIRPPELTLIEQGVFKNYLVSPRSAAEYGVPGNGAGDHEGPVALDMAAGALAMDEVLQALDTGLYIGNLWYLNYSDRNSARITGMTRFATFWVENGRIQSPVNVLRFDDSVYRLLGDQLLALTREREFLLDPGSYGARSSRSARLPGALIGNMRFTL